MEKNTVKNMVKQEPQVLQSASLFRARLMELCPDEKMLCELIAMVLDESIPYRMKADKVSSAEEYAVQVADLFGCTKRTAMAVAEIWLAAIPALPEKREYLGRRKCNTLKEIRKKIAEANGIPFFTEECSHEGPCRGTCPRCDAEIEYLNRELQGKIDRGEEVVLEGLGIENVDAYQEAVQNIEIKQPYEPELGQTEVPYTASEQKRREEFIEGADAFNMSGDREGFMNIPDGIDEELPFQ